MKSLSIFQKTRMILFDTDKFFKNVEKEKEYKTPLLYFLALWALWFIISLSFVYLYSNMTLAMFKDVPLPESSGMGASYGDFIADLIIFSTFVMGIFYLIGGIIGIPIFHIFVRLFGGKQGMLQTGKINLYCMAPFFLLGWNGFTSVIGALWGFYILYRGLVILQRLSNERAAILIFLTTFLTIALVFAGIVLLAIL